LRKREKRERERERTEKQKITVTTAGVLVQCVHRNPAVPISSATKIEGEETTK
jgi:hypothetical protein